MFNYHLKYLHYDRMCRRALHERPIRWNDFERYSMLASIMHLLSAIQKGKKRGRCVKKLKSYEYRLKYVRERYKMFILNNPK